MATWTTPRTWPEAYLVGSADLNQHLRDNLQALYDAQHDVASRVTYIGPTAYTMHVGSSASGGPELFSTDFSWTSDGSSYIVEFFCASATCATNPARICLTDGTGAIITVLAEISAGTTQSVFARYWYTPASGARALNVVGVVATGGSGSINAGNGGSTVTSYPPAYLRVYGVPI